MWHGGDNALYDASPSDWTSREIRDLSVLITQAANRHMGSVGFNAEYPPDVRLSLDRMYDIILSEECRAARADDRRRWLALHDAHSQVPIGAGSDGRPYFVGIQGLASERGRELNGSVGVIKGYDSASGRFRVEFGDERSGGDLQKNGALLKASNLKTPFGCARTNGFEDGLFEVRCRMNHRCGSACNTDAWTVDEWNGMHASADPPLIARHPEEIVVVASRDIQKGEELTNDYFGGDRASKELRQEQLWEKYRFKCECENCRG